MKFGFKVLLLPIAFGLAFLFSAKFKQSVVPIQRYLPWNWNISRFAGVGEDDTPCDRLLKTVVIKNYEENATLHDKGGCPLPHLSAIEAHECLSGELNYLFVGDSRVRQLFVTFWDSISHDAPSNWTAFHHNDLRKIAGIKVEFIWQPRSNLKQVFGNVQKQYPKLDLIVVGSGVWGARETNGTANGLLEYKKNLTETMTTLTKLTNRTQVIWVMQDPVSEGIIDERRKMLSNKLLNEYNLVAKELMLKHSIKIWYSARAVSEHFPKNYYDCVHQRRLVHGYKAQLLLSWLCNRKKQNPTCCT